MEDGKIEQAKQSPMKRATNAAGQEVNLPAKPERQEFETEDEWEEALSGWNHSVLPLLSLQRPSTEAPPVPESNG